LKGLFLRGRKRSAPEKNQARHLAVESLEDRSLLAAVAGALSSDRLLLVTGGVSLPSPVIAGGPAPSSSVAPGGAARAVLVDDAYEQNDTLATARNLGTLSGPLTINNLVMADANDWYRFTINTRPGAGDSVAINFQNSRGNLDLALYNVNGMRLRYSTTSNNTERVSLSGLTAGTYYVRVYGYLGATNPSYSLSINLARPLADDAYENNDTFATARPLGTLTSAVTISGLVMADGHDWYRFTMSGAGTSSDFVAVSSASTQGDLDLELYNASGTRLAISQSPTNNERLSLAGRAAGTYYVHVYGYGGAITPSYVLQIDPGTATTSTPPTSTGAFNIQFTFSGLTAAQQSIFRQAAAKWQSIIVGDLPSATYNGVAVDDLLIDARGALIDGVGNILGEAGPDRFRSGSLLPYHGVMEFDAADLASMTSSGTLLGVIEHEMGHVLGIGTIWSDKGLLVGAGTSNPIFVGAQATAAYNSIFGTHASGVPVENTGGSGTRDAHWRESAFGNELMTGWIGPGTSMPISRVTVGSLADLGYAVNFAAADPYTAASARTAVLVSSTVSTGTSSTLRVASNVGAAMLPLGEHVRDYALASWGTASQHDSLDQPLTVPSPSSHEAATDALLANWSLRTSGRFG